MDLFMGITPIAIRIQHSYGKCKHKFSYFVKIYERKWKMYAEVLKRLLPCIISGRPVPEDMVHLAYRKASSPVSYDSRYNWERVLALAF